MSCSCNIRTICQYNIFNFTWFQWTNRFCNVAKANIHLFALPHTCCLCRGTSVYIPPCTSWQTAWRRSLAACTLWVWLQSFLRLGCAVICCWGSDGRSRGPRVCHSLDSQRPRWTAMPDAGVPYCSERTRQKSREEWSHNCVGREDSQHLKHRTLKPTQFLSLMRSLYICIIINNLEIIGSMIVILIGRYIKTKLKLNKRL